MKLGEDGTYRDFCKWYGGDCDQCFKINKYSWPACFEYNGIMGPQLPELLEGKAGCGGDESKEGWKMRDKIEWWIYGFMVGLGLGGIVVAQIAKIMGC